MPDISKKPMKRRAAKCPLAWAAEKLQCPQQPQFKGGEEDEQQWTEWTGGGDGLAAQNLECQEERQQHCVCSLKMESAERELAANPEGLLSRSGCVRHWEGQLPRPKGAEAINESRCQVCF